MAEMERGRERERVTNSTEIDIERNRRLFNDSKKGVVHYDIYIIVRTQFHNDFIISGSGLGVLSITTMLFMQC